MYTYFYFCRFGTGYHLTLVKGPACKTARLSELVTSTVPGSQLDSDVSAELSFLLPFTSTQHFPQLLDALEGGSIFHDILYIINLAKYMYITCTPETNTVEPPNNGHIRSKPFVHCREVVLSWRLSLILVVS